MTIKFLFYVFISFPLIVNCTTVLSELYNEDPGWMNLYAEGGMYIGNGRTKRFVEVSEGQANIPHQACLLPNGTQGHCRHLHHCVMEDFKNDFLKFMDYFCVIKRSAIGVCCPDSLMEERAGSLAGDLPATAPKEEENEALNRIRRAENRGCGLSTRAQPKLIGARPADPREWPWMVSLTPEGFKQHCGGTLITDRHVLTAAHCVRRWKADELFVRLGEYDFTRGNDSRSYNFRVVEVRSHEDFEFATYHHDIAILKLHRPAVFNTYVWPVCLPPIGLEIENNAIVIGWGAEFYGGTHSDILNEVSIPIWDKQRCMEAITYNVFNESICAGGYDGGKDSCQGDSGGPLLYQMPSGRWAIIGIVSWGVRCGEPNRPGIYTKVDEYLTWIVQNTRF